MQTLYSLEQSLVAGDCFSIDQVDRLNKDITDISFISKDDTYLKWLKFLISDDTDNFTEFIHIYNNSDSLLSAMMIYRRNIRLTGRGSINNSELLGHYNGENWCVVKDMLQEKSLEYVNINIFNRFISLLHTQKIEVHSLLLDMERFPNMRLMSFVL